MSKLLYISNIAGKRFSTNFVGTALSAAKELGIEFYVVANRSASTKDQIQADENEYGVHLLHADINRSPFSISNYKAYKQIEGFIKQYDIDYIHCNTPVGGIIGRLVGKKCKVKRVIYQVHGFHFYKGAPLKNWLLFYPVEKVLAYLTDCLITINTEDYSSAKRFRLRNHGKVYYVPGVGIDLSAFEPGDFQRNIKRAEFGLNHDDIIVISTGDLIKRKNYETAIKAIEKTKNTKIKYYICGQGPLKERLEKLSKDLGIESQVRFLGYRDDVKELLWMSDIFLFTTYQEGLSRSLSEAIAAGLPCVVSKIRGNIDLIDNGTNGFLCSSNDVDGFSRVIRRLADDVDLRKKIGNLGKEKLQEFSTDKVIQAIVGIYKEELGQD